MSLEWSKTRNVDGIKRSFPIERAIPSFIQKDVLVYEVGLNIISMNSLTFLVVITEHDDLRFPFCEILKIGDESTQVASRF